MSAIEWTDDTWNPVTGCTRASKGCDNCYAVTMTHRLEAMGQTEKYGGLTVLNPKGDRHFNGVVRCHEDVLDKPLKRRKPTMYFVNSMSDLFHKDVPFEFIDKVFAVMALCPQHVFQILTKRPERMAEYLNEESEVFCRVLSVADAVCELEEEMGVTLRPPQADEMSQRGLQWPEWPLPNVWLGTSVEDQQAADERIPHLLKCPAAVRFLSCEPLLGAVDLDPYLFGDTRHDGDRNSVDWVIVGGESGPKARECRTSWIRGIVDQCKSAGVPVFVKQLGVKPVMTRSEWSEITIADSWTGFADSPDGLGIAKLPTRKGTDPIEWPDDLRVREYPAQEAKA